MQTCCPHCQKPVPCSPRELLVGVIIGLECCGYVPRAAEALRWALVERWRIGLDRIGWRIDERRLGLRRHGRPRVPPRPPV